MVKWMWYAHTSNYMQKEIRRSSKRRIRMIGLVLICVLAFAAALGRILIFAEEEQRTSFRSLFSSRSLWHSFVFFGVGLFASASILFWDVFAVLHLMTLFRVLCTLGVLVILFGMSVLFTIGHRHSKWGILALAFLLLTMLAEGFCNFRAFQSAEYEKVDLLPYMTSATGWNTSTDETRKLPNEPDTYSLSGSLVMEFTDLNFELDNLWMDVRVPGTGKSGDAVTVTLSLTDEGNENYYDPKQKTFSVVPKDERSRWISLDTAGASEKLKLTVSTDSKTLQIDGIWANAQRPVRVSVLRMMVIFALSFGLYIIRPNSPLYAKKLSDSGRQTACTTTVILVNIALAFAIVACGNAFLSKSGYSKQHRQYQELAERLVEGEVTLEDEVPEFLLNMENPYDRTARDKAAKEAGESYRWDVAYYDGNYYVYFGVTPVLLMYLPFYLVTGDSTLPNDVVVLTCVAFFIVGVFLLIRRFLRQKYPDAPYLLYLLLSLLVANCSGIINLLIYPSLYTVPISMGLALTVWGLNMWLEAMDKPTLFGWKLAVGSLCMALVAGCRPQMLLWSFLAIPLFYKSFLKDKTLLPTSKNGVKNLACFAVPYIVVAAGLMYYNAIRFGSPFDFGANYNLTTNDMTVRDFRMGRIAGALFSYLLQCPKMIATYPFIRNCDYDTMYVGTTIRESVFGGLFMTTPFVWFGLAAFGFRKWLREHRLFGATVFLLLCGVAVAVVDAQMAGILQRYFSDFSLFFVTAAALVFVVLHQRVGDVGRKSLTALLIIALGVTCWHGATLVFQSSYLTMPVWLKTAMQFWM